MVDAEIWVCVVIFGIDFSNQNRSSRAEVRFWLMVRLECGLSRCVVAE